MISPSTASKIQALHCVCARSPAGMLVPLLVLIAFLSGFGCGQSQPDTPAPSYIVPKPLPPLGPAISIEPGISMQEVILRHGSINTRILIYLPTKSSSAKLPCIFIAPAGSRLFHGMKLEKGDQPEHLPYVRAGYAVVAYELDGPVSDHPNEQELIRAARAFKDANAGLNDARLAMHYALAKVPQIDANRLYAAGHSSAATEALYLASQEPRIKACIAYAPACYLERRLGTRIIQSLTKEIPGFEEFIHNCSPDTNVDKIKCPVFIFHADDDRNVGPQQVAPFVSELKRHNAEVTYVTVPSGDHYDSMIAAGIPRAIEWLKNLPQ